MCENAGVGVCTRTGGKEGLRCVYIVVMFCFGVA